MVVPNLKRSPKDFSGGEISEVIGKLWKKKNKLTNVVWLMFAQVGL